MIVEPFAVDLHDTRSYRKLQLEGSLEKNAFLHWQGLTLWLDSARYWQRGSNSSSAGERESASDRVQAGGGGSFDLVKRGPFRGGVVFHRVNLSCLLLMRNRRAPQREKFFSHLSRNEGSCTFCIFKNRSSSICQSYRSKAGDTAAVVMTASVGRSLTDCVAHKLWSSTPFPSGIPPPLFTTTLQAPDDCCGSYVGGPPSVS